MSWAYYGTACFVKNEELQDYSPLFRAFDGKHHHYSMNEADFKNKSKYEEICVVCYLSNEEKRGLEPIFVLKNTSTGDNVLCVTEEDKNNALESGYKNSKLLGYVGLTNAYSRVPLYVSFDPLISDHFYTTKSSEIDQKGPTLDMAGLFNELNKQIGNFTVKDPKFYPTDNIYFCPTEEVAQDIIDNSMIDHMTYTAEILDCDDFVQLLKSAFILDAYENGNRTLPYCFGIAFGKRNVSHAINLIVVSDGSDYKVKFVNPETGQITEPDIKEFHDIYMIMF